jgi:DNA-binding NarL/FixJ family response regulator
MPDRIISVLLVDDHSLVRHGFRRMLEDSPDIQVVGEASDGHDAVEIAGKLHPDVVVMDFALPSMNGAVATRNILKVSPGTRVLIVSMHSESVYVQTCMNAGARGYLLKNAMELELVDAVKHIADGEKFLDSRLGLDIRSQAAEAPSLTTRELEVLQLIVHGKSNKDIAVVLGVSSNTVGVHRANIMQTLGIHNTAELVVYAIRNGLVSIA